MQKSVTDKFSSSANCRKYALISNVFAFFAPFALLALIISSLRLFLGRAAGGEELTLVPCLNDHPLWVATLENWVRAYLSGEGGPRDG